MKKLFLLAATLIFIGATATFAQTTDQNTTKKETTKASVATEKNETPKACCKAGSSKSCCKSNATGSKSCSHDHADAGKQDDKTAPVGKSADETDTPKK